MISRKLATQNNYFFSVLDYWEIAKGVLVHSNQIKMEGITNIDKYYAPFLVPLSNFTNAQFKDRLTKAEHTSRKLGYYSK